MAIKRSISLYSYQQAYYLGQLDLEGCVAAAAATGATGIELIPEQMPVGNFPNPRRDDIAWWKDLMAKYGCPCSGRSRCRPRDRWKSYHPPPWRS